MKTFLATILATVLTTTAAKAAGDDFPFSHITMQDGLSSNKINSIYRDGQGFVWFSTPSGLNRFDGYSMKSFIREQTDTAVADVNYVSRVHDIADDCLLVTLRNSYTIFDKRSETFKSAQNLFTGTGFNPATAVVSVDSKRDVWIADGSSCCIYSTQLNTLVQNGVATGTDSRITAITEHGGLMYAAHADGSITTFEPDRDGKWRLRGHETTPMQKEANPDLFIDSSGNIWLYPRDSYGLWFKSSATGEWTQCTDKSAEPLRVPDFIIRKVVEDAEGRIWVASDHGGINVIDLKSRRMAKIRSRKNAPRGLSSNSIGDLYADSQGCVWVGDVSLGLSVYGGPIFKFRVDNLEAGDIDPDFVAQVNCVAEDEHGDTWYGTNDNGLLRIDSRTGGKRIFKKQDGNANSIASNVVVSLCPDGKGGLWIGTFLGGLCHYDGNKFARYSGKAGVAPAAASGNVWTVCTTESGDVCVGSLGQGAAVLHQVDGTWQQWRQKDGLSSDYVTKVVSLRDGRVAVGTSEGLSVIDLSRGNCVTQVRDSLLRHNINITDLCFDSRGLIWACTNTGLHVVDGKTLKYVRHIGLQDGLTTETTLGVVEDKRRTIWVATTHGMASIDVIKDERDGRTEFHTYNYNDQDATLTGSINERAMACTSTDEIIVGRANGVNRFRPEEIRYNTERPHVFFTALSTFGKETPIGTSQDGAFTLPQALAYCHEIEIPYNVNMFTVNFSTLSNILPEKVTYTYKLDGFNDNWLTTSDHSATYTNLAPGSYELMVRASNCDGLESAEASTLRIIITPPWWRTYWAYAFYTLSILTTIFLSIKWIRDRDKAKFRIRQMLDEVEHQQQVDNLKLRFFTNISHELRTPLSLIVSPLENILDTMPSSDPKHSQIEIVHRNAVKLLGMVNQLLDFRKADMGGMTLNLSEGDLASFVSQHCDAYIALDKKNIKFSFTTAEENIYMRFDKDKVGKIINNLLSNAFKFTPEGGMVSVALNLSGDRRKAVIAVTDSGIGIPDEHKQHIFERFYQVPQKDSSLAGSGIGLHLVKDFTSLHNGTIEVSDNPAGQGSVFTVNLPVDLGAQETDNASCEGASVRTNEEIQTTEKEPTTARTPDNGKKKIVIVDDNDDFLALLRDTLGSDYELIEAHNGQEAWDKIVTTMPDMIITDVMMPVMDGNELCAKVKNDIRTSHIPLVMLTAKTAEEHNIEGLANGADDYLTKPFNNKILRLKVEKMIEQGERRQETFKNQIEPEPSQITITPLDEQLIKKAIDYVEQNIASPSLSVEDLSRNLGMSRVHLYKKLMTITGRPPIEFIRVIRLKRAAQLLTDPAQNVADVAYAVGFNNPKYFTKYFKEEFGVLPSKYYQTACKDKRN